MNSLLDKPEHAGSLIARLKFTGKPKDLFKSGMTVRQYLQTLVQAELHLEAVRLLALTLERRIAVWWACSCVRQGLTSEDSPEEQAALEAAEKWVINPTDENRRACGPVAEAVDYGTPAGCAATAALWSEGSLAEPGLPEVKPPEHLLPGAVSNAVLLAAVRREPVKAKKRFVEFLSLGVDIAEGKNRWKDTSVAPSPQTDRPRATTPKPGTRPPVPRRP